MELLTCPCCGYKTITGEFDICDVCGWEHDSVQEESLDDAEGPNRVSFREAQRNVAAFGAKSEEARKHAQDPAGYTRDPNWLPLPEASIAFITCPCCGYKTITTSFDICKICFWEHDPQREETPDEAGGANGVPLRQAQANFAEFGAMDKESLKWVRRPTPNDVRDPHWKPLA